MTEVELRKLKRTELLELLLVQTKEKERLQQEVTNLKNQLNSRELKINKAGTLAEAAFEMNGVLEAAQAAAQQYLDNIKSLSDRQEHICATKEKEIEARCIAKEQAVHERCSLMKQETEYACRELESTTKARCEEMEAKIIDRCNSLEAEMKEKCASMEQETVEKCAAMTQKAHADVENRWADLCTRLEAFYNAHAGLRDLLTANGGILRD